MIGKILCAFGWHKIETSDPVSCFGFRHTFLTCSRCGQSLGIVTTREVL